jgi:MFS family permease
MLVSVSAVSSVFFSPLIGRAMDRRGRRAVLLLGNGLNVGAVALYLLIDGIGPALWALQVFHGLAQTLMYAGFFTYAADILPAARRTQGLALFGTSALLALSVGGYLGDLAIAAGGYPGLFAAALAAGAAALVLALTLDETHSAATAPEDAPRRWRDTLAQPDLLPIWLAAGAFFVTMAGVFVFYKAWVLESGLGTLGGFFTVYTGTAIVLRVLLGWVPDRTGPVLMVVPSLLAYAAGLVVLGIADAVWQVIAAAFLCGIGHGYGFPVLLSLVHERVRNAERGTAMSIFTAIDDGSVLVAGPALGLVAEAAGYDGMFLVAAGLLIAGTLVFAWHIGFNREVR